MRRLGRTAMVVCSTMLAVGCSDAGTAPENGEATILGRVEQTVTPTGTMMAPAAASAAAQSVFVAEVQSDGSLAQVAEGTVEADGSFQVVGIPSGRENLVVVARDETLADVGRVLVHERTAADASISVAPIDVSTTLEARVFSEARASGGPPSSAEVTLFVHASPDTPPGIVAASEVQAASSGVVAAGQTLTSVFDETGASLDAAARAELLTSAAVAFADARYAGTSQAVAEDALLEDALDGFVGAGPSLEAMVQATAAGATIMDASLVGQSTYRGEHVTEAVRLNLRARRRLAAELTGSAEGPVASHVLYVLGIVEGGVMAASTAAEIGAALEAGVAASLGEVLQATVDLLTPDADALLVLEVETLATEAAQEADLPARLAAATTAQEAAAAVGSYRADVRAAVEAMVTASGSEAVDVDALTSVFIAAYGGPAIH
jgi:hypothetical protein